MRFPFISYLIQIKVKGDNDWAYYEGVNEFDKERANQIVNTIKHGNKDITAIQLLKCNTIILKVEEEWFRE